MKSSHELCQSTMTYVDVDARRSCKKRRRRRDLFPCPPPFFSSGFSVLGQFQIQDGIVDKVVTALSRKLLLRVHNKRKPK